MGERSLVGVGTMRYRVLLVLLLIALVVLSGCRSAKETSRSPARPVGQLEGIYLVVPDKVKRGKDVPTRGVVAPDFAFVTDDGVEYRLSDLRGRPVVLNFWATWCPPCRAEMPALDAAYLEYKDEGLVILAVNQMDNREQVERFREAMGLHMPIVLDTQGAVGQAYWVRGLPTSFFVDAEGQVALRWTGMLTEKSLDKGLRLILGASSWKKGHDARPG